MLKNCTLTTIAQEIHQEISNLFIKIDTLNKANLLLSQENTITNEILSQKETIRRKANNA